MPRVTKAAKQAFLAALEQGHTVSAAADIASFNRQNIYLHRSDEAFAAAWDAALEEGEQTRNDIVRTELQRRAVEGIEEPVYYQGKVVGTIRRYSDTLLLAMANNLLPEYDHPSRVEHTGPGGTPLEIKLAFDPGIPAAQPAAELVELKALPRAADDGA